MRTIVVGRSPHADATLADAGVALRHLELTEIEDGRWYAVDAAGPDADDAPQTLLRAAGAERWTPLRQNFVAPEDLLRLGPHAEWTVAALIAKAAARAEGVDGRRGNLQTGRVERDPATGEIVRRAE